jgi:hypothetical protein
LLIRPRSHLSTFAGASPLESPPKLKTSSRVRELMNELPDHISRENTVVDPLVVPHTAF